jgi:sortase A
MNTTEQAHRRPRRRATRLLGTTVMVAGLALIAWSFVVWRWNDPITSLYTHWQQSSLESQLAALTRQEAARSIPAALSEADTAELVARRAARFRRRATVGGAIGRISIPRLGLDMVLVNGTDTATLKKGPGRDLRTFMPGQGNLVYIAGHRTTYGAPFARIDDLRPGDRVTLEMPYATLQYAVTTHRIVDDQDLSVLRARGREVLALQACHPRFFASRRYIVWARPVTGSEAARPSRAAVDREGRGRGRRHCHHAVRVASPISRQASRGADRRPNARH